VLGVFDDVEEGDEQAWFLFFRFVSWTEMEDDSLGLPSATRELPTVRRTYGVSVNDLRVKGGHDRAREGGVVTVSAAITQHTPLTRPVMRVPQAKPTLENRRSSMMG